MRIRVGYEITYDCPQPTPFVLTLRVHPSRAHDLAEPDLITTRPALRLREYVDGFGNICSRLTFPAGRTTVTTETIVRDSGQPDPVVADAGEHAVEDLPDECLVFLIGSRYCETDRLSNTAWSLFGQRPKGWPLVQAICDHVHDRITFGYAHASPTKTAFDAYTEKQGVCRDFAHLAVTLCRCMNIPARYCTGYLGDIGVPLDDSLMDFSAWFVRSLSRRLLVHVRCAAQQA